MKRRLLIVLLYLFVITPPLYAAATWTPQINTSQEALNDIHFLSDRVGWTVGDGGTILNTTDRGGNWTSQASGTGLDLNGVHVLDSTHGWAVGQSRTVAEYDGSSWTASQIGPAVNLDLTKVFMTDADTIWISGGVNFSGITDNFRNLFYSTDGGGSWQNANVRNTAEASDILNYFHSVYFTDANHGWLVGINSSSEGRVFKTTDAGTSWSDVTPPNTADVTMWDAYFPSTSEGWVSGGNPGPPKTGYIYHTANGGVSWETEFTFSPALLKSVHGSNNTNLWASDQGSVFRYESGAWVEDSTPVSTGYFNAVFVNDISNIWVVGGQLTAEGGAKRYVYKYVVEPENLRVDRTLFISPTTYEVGVGFAGDNIQSNAVFSIEAAAGLTVTTYEAVYESFRDGYKIDADVLVDPAVAVAGTHAYFISNPDDGTFATGSLTLTQSAQPEERLTAVPVPESVWDPNEDNELQVYIGMPGQVGPGGVQALNALPAAFEGVEMELIVYRFSNRQLAFRRKFKADNPAGVKVITLQRLTDLGFHVSEGVYEAVVIHPTWGVVGRNAVVVHYK